MSDDKSTDDADNTVNTGKTTHRRPRTRWVLMGIAGALVVAIAGTALSTGGYSKWRGGGHDFGKYVEWRIDDMLEEVEATDDQRTQVRAIVTAAIADMGEFREFKREGRRALVEALTRETVDRAELEALRQRKLETVDGMSQRMLTALADAAEVLTHAQRQELAAEWKSRKHRHKHDHKKD